MVAYVYFSTLVKIKYRKSWDKSINKSIFALRNLYQYLMHLSLEFVYI